MKHYVSLLFLASCTENALGFSSLPPQLEAEHCSCWIHCWKGLYVRWRKSSPGTLGLDSVPCWQSLRCTSWTFLFRASGASLEEIIWQTSIDKISLMSRHLAGKNNSDFNISANNYASNDMKTILQTNFKLSCCFWNIYNDVIWLK